MELFQAVFGRQSIGKVKPDPVPRHLVERALAAAVQAPNHHRIRPWRFTVLTGLSRHRLGDVMAKSLQQKQPDTSEPALDVERARPLRAPVLVAVAVDKPSEPKISEIENICAAAAAAQNMLLAVHALGLAGMWRTGPAATDTQVKAFLGLEPDQHLIGFLYIGYPEVEWPPKERPSFEDRTVWMEE
jgi:nitroreductase